MARADTDSPRTGRTGRGPGDNQVSEVVALVRSYAQQQTIEPLKGVGRYLALGVAGSVAIGIGVIELVVALLRVLQTETGEAFDGNWSWVPYVIVLVVAGAVVALALSAIDRSRAKRETRAAGGAR